MKAFQINKVVVEYSFGVDQQEHSKTETFPTIKAAREYIGKSARDWFMGSLESFINHKRHIIEAGNHSEQTEPLKKAWELYLSFEKLPVYAAANNFLLNHKTFLAILPVTENKSYESSRKNLDELASFCQSIVQA